MTVSFAGLTVVAGTAITATWGNMVRSGCVVPYASAAARASEVTSPEEGMVSYLIDSKTLHVHNGSQWVRITPDSAAVDTQQTTTSTSYTDLSTVGPAVTVVTGTSALVTVCAQIKNSGADVSYMGVAVSGASTVAAGDTRAAEVVGTSTHTPSMTFKMTGLTAGSNTFTAKYRVVSGTGTFANRNITVQALP